MKFNTNDKYVTVDTYDRDGNETKRTIKNPMYVPDNHKW